MRKINDTMNRLAVAAYVKGGRMRKKLADVLPERRRRFRRYRIENLDFCCGWCVAAGRALCTVQGHHPSYPDAENPEPL